MDFPQYRCYNTKTSYFKILNERSFIEIQRVGDKLVVYEIHATQYPEMLRIMDMLDLKLAGIELVDQEVVEELLRSDPA